MAQRAAERLSPGEGRKFGVTVGGVLVVLALVVWLRGRPLASACLAVPGGILFLAGWAVPSRLGPVQAAWMALARAISRVTTPLVLGIVYFGVLTPTGLLLRWFGKDPLARARSGEGLWVGRTPGHGPAGSMERQF